MRAVWLAGVLTLATATLAFAGDVAKRPTLSVGVKPLHSGTITSSPRGINCGSDCDLSARKGAVVTLKAKPKRGWKFRRWGFACKGTKPTCRLTMTRSKRAAAAFLKKTPPPPPPPPPPPSGFTPALIRGMWSGSWTDTRFNTTGPASIAVTVPSASSFHFEATFGGTVFGCAAQPTVSANVVQGPGGANQWNANGFSIDFTTQNGGTAVLNHDFERRTLDGHGTPGCRPTVSWVLTGAFTTDYTTFNGSVTTTLEDMSTAPALLSLTKGSSKGGRG
jgi:hypothetical protein